MLKSTFQKILRHFAMRYGKFRTLFVKFCGPNPQEYAEFMRRHGKLYAIGNNCSMLPTTVFTDPAYVRMGNNVHLSSCTLIGHDGSITMLNQAYGVKLDSVGKIDIGDNVFIGHGAIVLPNVTIGSNSIVGAGAVVTRDVAEGDIVGGVPAKPIGRVANLVKKLQAQTQAVPWSDLIANREGSFDPAIEPLLVQLRVAHFYGNTSTPTEARSTALTQPTVKK